MLMSCHRLSKIKKTKTKKVKNLTLFYLPTPYANF